MLRLARVPNRLSAERCMKKQVQNSAHYTCLGINVYNSLALNRPRTAIPILPAIKSFIGRR